MRNPLSTVQAFVGLAVLGPVLCLAAEAAPTPAKQTPAAPIFVEAEGTGLDFVHFNGMSGQFFMAEINGGGGGVLDFDNDGDLDLYLVQGQVLGGERGISEALFTPAHPLPLTDRLYRNELVESGRLRFTDITTKAGLVAGDFGCGVASGDFDGDGWVDLYVTRLGRNVLLRNLGDGTFEDVTAKSGAGDTRWSVSASVADFDADGHLDLYIGNYLDFTPAKNKICRTVSGAQDYCGPTAYPGVPDRLLRNLGDGTFEDVTVAAGLHRERSKTLGVVSADLNGDGKLDFYVTNDLTPNQMWIQGEKGKFSDEALLAGSAVNGHGVAEASMGVDAADVDGDGDIDLFMTHLTRETNTLYLNDGQGMFEDATVKTGLGTPSWPYTSWGTAFFDYDNDGWLEMMIANGAVKVIEAQANEKEPFPFHEPNQLFHALGGGRFEEVTDRAGPVFALSEVSRALATADFDNDGDPDVLLINNAGPARILLNQVGQEQPWVGLRLLDAAGKKDALGARAMLTLKGGRRLWRRVRTDGSFAASNDPRILFGLGSSEGIEALQIDWPDGKTETFPAPPPRRYSILRQGQGRSTP